MQKELDVSNDWNQGISGFLGGVPGVGLGSWVTQVDTHERGA